MPQTGLSYERREHHSSWSTKRLVSKDSRSAGLINGVGVRTSETAAARSLYAPTPPCGPNSYINNKSKGTKRKPSSAANELAAGRAGGVLDVGVTGVNGVAHSHEFDRGKPDHCPLITSTHHGGRKTFKHKNKARKCEFTSAVTPSKEEENWENDIQDVRLHNWEKMCFGVNPYGPEELLHFAVRGTTLTQRVAGELPATIDYNPKVHHPHPIKWSCYSVPSEPEQFADADD
ncbi:uncharacterized protein LOC101172876 isoform X2 [Oryzias latipes]